LLAAKLLLSVQRSGVHRLAFILLAVTASAIEPKANEIIKKSVIVNDADFQALSKYSHFESDVEVKLDSAGRQKSKTEKTFQVIMIDGSPYEKLATLNGHPLSPADQRKEEQKLKQEIAKRRSESGPAHHTRISKFQKERNNDHLLMQQMVDAFNFTLIGEETVNGHPAYVLDAVPRPDYRPINQEAKVLTGMKGRLWVDKAGYHWIKVKAEVIKPVSYALFLAKVGPGTRFEFEQAPVTDKLWLPKRFEQDVNAAVIGMFPIRTRTVETYTKYRLADEVLASLGERPAH
jgi:hypothetical protein